MDSADIRASHRTHGQGEEMGLRRDLKQMLENPQEPTSSARFCFSSSLGSHGLSLCFSLDSLPFFSLPLPPLTPQTGFSCSVSLTAILWPSVQTTHRNSLPLEQGPRFPGGRSLAVSAPDKDPSVPVRPSGWPMHRDHPMGEAARALRQKVPGGRAATPSNASATWSPRVGRQPRFHFATVAVLFP